MFEQAKNSVYHYIQGLVQHLPPEEALTAFYALLWDRVTPYAGEVRDALTAVIEDERFREEPGLHFLNRSYYTICNPWHLDSAMMPYLRQLIGRLDELPTAPSINPSTQRLRERLQDFSRGEYGDCLRRQMRLGGYEAFAADGAQGRYVLGDYLPDYFCLYRAVTRTPDIEQLENDVYSNPAQSGIGAKQLTKLRQTYDAVYRYRELRQQGVTNLIPPSKLETAVFERGLDHYYPQRQGSFDGKAQVLSQHQQSYQRYGSYRPVVQDYLMASIDSFPERTRVKLSEAIRRALNSFDGQSPMEAITLTNLFLRLLDAVLLPEFNFSHILRLKRSVQDATPLEFSGMLLSLVLACPMLRFNLERKLGYIYRIFETCSIEAARWVVDFFEHINLALVMNARKIGYFSLMDSLPEVA